MYNKKEVFKNFLIILYIILLIGISNPIRVFYIAGNSHKTGLEDEKISCAILELAGKYDLLRNTLNTITVIAIILSVVGISLIIYKLIRM